ncbi:MAG TPA: sugar phosphate isomerase/epimerase family protein [Bryobacteraceae bacterium]|nr:sugar phosphate isomerase/epimerase family protein [Bryobacteraceae bacterium]
MERYTKKFMPYRFGHAICNECFVDWEFSDVCRAVKKAGYEGLEIAPFTLTPEPATLTTARRKEVSRIMRDEGLEFVGLHWLMVAPKGLHVTTDDEALRKKSWRHIHDMVDLCADIDEGHNGKRLMVFGSPKQREALPGVSLKEATKRFRDGFAEIAPHAEERGVTMLVESLGRNQCNIVNTAAEAVEIMDSIGSPAVQTMFDTHNAVDETEPHADVVGKYYDKIRHIHVNELDGGHCGTGDYDFKPLLRTLAARKYTGWVSLEAFIFEPGGERIANESLRYLEGEIAKL